jgi:phenylalanine-4-hydroxylase
MVQNYSAYTEEDFDIWKILFEKQVKNLQGKVHPKYFEYLDQLKPVLNANKIPDFNELNEALYAGQGWTIEVVPGLIPVKEFFYFLSVKRFCSSTWMRSRSQLEYLEEPDMFHDIFGHTPLLLNKEYSDFTQEIGRLGYLNWENEEIVKQLQRLYWYTIEFGLIQEPGSQTKIYGAGIISSYSESNHVFEDGVNHIPFELKECMTRDFVIPEVQVDYYRINSFSQLYDTLSKVKIQ